MWRRKFHRQSNWFLLSSLVSAANLSTTLFLNGLCLPEGVGTGLAEGETCQAKSDWPLSGDLFFLSLIHQADGKPLRSSTSSLSFQHVQRNSRSKSQSYFILGL